MLIKNELELKDGFELFVNIHIWFFNTQLCSNEIINRIILICFVLLQKAIL